MKMEKIRMVFNRTLSKEEKKEIYNHIVSLYLGVSSECLMDNIELTDWKNFHFYETQKPGVVRKFYGEI